MRVSFDWLKDFMDGKIDVTKTQSFLTMTGLEITSMADIEGDHVMEIEVTPNRPDCLSILGIARELSAASGISIKLPDSIRKNFMRKGNARGGVKIEILDKHACSRYVGCIMKNVKVGPSPKWLAQRLNAMGVRSVNNIVDITNYALFELGQPLHAFDLDKLEGKRIIVRRAKKGESIITIDGITRTLDPNVLVIADALRPVAIAGIMGGKDTEITADTKNILIESACFNPVVIRKACRQLGAASESSYRFERGVDQAMIFASSVRAQELIKETAGGKSAGKMSDVGIGIEKEKEISLSLGEVARILGIDISPEKIKDIFKKLNLNPVRKKDKIFVTVPSYRQDLNKDIDLIEEIARFYGYDKVPSRLPFFTPQKTYQLEKKTLSLENEIRHILCGMGLNEIMTYSLTSRNSIERLGVSLENLVSLKNPMSSQQEIMRPSLLSEMLEVLNWNLNRRNTLLQLFELNKVYIMNKATGQADEVMHLSIGICGNKPGNWKEKSRDLDFFDLKGIIEILMEHLVARNYRIEKTEHPSLKENIATVIIVNGKACGVFGEVKEDVARRFDIKRKVYIAEISLNDLFASANLKKTFIALPKYPSIKRDIAILLDDTITASSIYDVIKEEARELVKSVDVFDLYKGQQIEVGKKSLAYTIEYRSDERTLNDKEVNDIHKKVQEALTKRLGAQIR
ncbi:MAG TPA: phenylalanine--tRNA ligase subunit beta [Candidatus Omnitrophica bacterium]|nr:phenylalanine--tRNA ligase subunit beta [Candidatus Omnitrophota bacterium]